MRFLLQRLASPEAHVLLIPRRKTQASLSLKHHFLWFLLGDLVPTSRGSRGVHRGPLFLTSAQFGLAGAHHKLGIILRSIQRLLWLGEGFRVRVFGGFRAVELWGPGSRPRNEDS